MDSSSANELAKLTYPVPHIKINCEEEAGGGGDNEDLSRLMSGIAFPCDLQSDSSHVKKSPNGGSPKSSTNRCRKCKRPDCTGVCSYSDHSDCDFAVKCEWLALSMIWCVCWINQYLSGSLSVAFPMSNLLNQMVTKSKTESQCHAVFLPTNHGETTATNTKREVTTH